VKKEINSTGKAYFISVIIPVRNEEKNIGTLLESLQTQDYLHSNFEVIIVDDHSTDGSLEKFKGRLPNLISFSLGEDENGKKAALTYGIKNAKGEIIATTDADCLLPSDWLTTINSVFQDEQINMAAGMVAISDEDNFFSQWQAMEFASVMGTSAAALGLKKPMMCNGANLSFRREVFHLVKGYEGNEHIASGDDEFLMQKIQNQFPDSIQIVNSIVVTRPQASLKGFLSQRIRWASKWKGNPLIAAKLLAVFIFLIQVSWIVLLGTFYQYDSKTVFIIFLLKIVADMLFLLPVFRFMKINFRLLPFLGLQFFYPFYVIFVGLLAPWISYQWKDRKIL
ncbi:MAG TPA: glycosyltransferase, partial [Cyclobacteriaceae bacterium]|nr:glycosyltransferase [Cyclobacteriaceae bacterium]